MASLSNLSVNRLRIKDILAPNSDRSWYIDCVLRAKSLTSLSIEVDYLVHLSFLETVIGPLPFLFIHLKSLPATQ